MMDAVFAYKLQTKCKALMALLQSLLTGQPSWALNVHLFTSHQIMELPTNLHGTQIVPKYGRFRCQAVSIPGKRMHQS